jgi:hypothetical protein
VEQRVLVTVKDAICFMKNLGQILTAQTLRPSIETPMLDGGGRAAARPQSKLRCGGGERATLGSGGARSTDAIKLDAVVYPSWNNPPH